MTKDQDNISKAHKIETVSQKIAGQISKGLKEIEDVAEKECNRAVQLIMHRLSAIKSIFSEFAKLSLIAYGIGFFIVNFSLKQYGFVTYDIASSRFFIAGVLFILICSLIFLTLEACKRMSSKKDRFFIHVLGFYFLIMGLENLLDLKLFRDLSGQPSDWLTLVPLLALVVTFIFLFILSYHFEIKNKFLRRYIKVAIIVFSFIGLTFYGTKSLYSLALFILFVAIQFFLYFPIEKSRRIIMFIDIEMPWVLVCIIVLFLFTVSTFSIQLYPRIDRMRGGGLSLRGSVIMSQNQMIELKDSLSNFYFDFNNATIVHESAESVFLALNNKTTQEKTALEIPKKNLLGIRYFKVDK